MSFQPRKLAAALVSLLLCLVLPMANMSLASTSATAYCCCGEHSLEEECGCPDCPATHKAEQGSEDEGPRLQGCRAESDFDMPHSADRCVLPSLLSLAPCTGESLPCGGLVRPLVSRDVGAVGPPS